MAAIRVITFLAMGQLDVLKGMLNVGDDTNCEPDVHVGVKGCIEPADVDGWTEVVVEVKNLRIVFLRQA